MKMTFTSEAAAPTAQKGFPPCKAKGCWHHADSINDMCRIHAAFPPEVHSIVTEAMKECASLIWIAQSSTCPEDTPVEEWNQAFNILAVKFNESTCDDRYPYAFPLVTDLEREGAAEEALMAGLRKRVDDESQDLMKQGVNEAARFRPIPYAEKQAAKL